MGIEEFEELQKQASEASLNRLSTNTVGIVNSIRTEGFDPNTNRPADEETPGTGCAVRWGEHHFILTAEHVIHQDAKPSDLRISWRLSGDLERKSAANLEKQDIVDPISIHDPNAAIYRCTWEDLAIIKIAPEEAGPFTEFVDITKEWHDPLEGDIVHCCGFPFDKGLVVKKQMIGSKEERIVALRPDVFSGPVLPLPTEDELKFKITKFDPTRHYLVPYQQVDSKHPKGISGAAMWWEGDKMPIVWKPNFKFAGVCTLCYKNGTVERVVKASTVRQFVEEVFGPAA